VLEGKTQLFVDVPQGLGKRQFEIHRETLGLPMYLIKVRIHPPERGGISS